MEIIRAVVKLINSLIDKKHYSASVIEQAIVLLSCLIELNPGEYLVDIKNCFISICLSEYKYYIIEFMNDLLKGDRTILIKDRFENKKLKIGMLGILKTPEVVVRYLYKISNDSLSRLLRESVNTIWEKETSTNDWAKQYEDELFSGILYFLTVSSLLSLVHHFRI